MRLSAELTLKILPLILLPHRKIQNLLLPSGGMGLRVDSAMYSGYSIPPYYDSMIAKVIVHGENRFDALMKMQRALNEIVTEGIITNAEFQLI